MRPNKGASPLTCRSEFEIVPVFRRNDLLALMLNFQTPGGMGQVMSCGLQVRVELKHSKTQTLKHLSVPFSGLCSRAAQSASRDGDIISKIWASGELFSRLAKDREEKRRRTEAGARSRSFVFCALDSRQLSFIQPVYPRQLSLVAYKTPLTPAKYELLTRATSASSASPLRRQMRSPVALQAAVGRGVPPRCGGVGTRRPTLWWG